MGCGSSPYCFALSPSLFMAKTLTPPYHLNTTPLTLSFDYVVKLTVGCCKLLHNYSYKVCK